MILKLDNRSLCTERNKIGDSLPWDATKALRAEQTRLGNTGAKKQKTRGNIRREGIEKGGCLQNTKEVTFKYQLIVFVSDPHDRVR